MKTLSKYLVHYRSWRPKLQFLRLDPFSLVQDSSIQFSVTNDQNPVLRLLFPFSSHQHPATNIQYPVSSIQHPVSSISQRARNCLMLSVFLLSALLSNEGKSQTPDVIISKIDANMNSETRIVNSDMIIYGKRNSRTVSSIGYAKGIDQSFTEYLAPAREKGTKMLKLTDRLWIYSPGTDRTIQLSGHMLRQSVMGSDLSYEDMMETRKLTEMYDATVIGNEDIDGRATWILELKAKVKDVSYETRKIWVDQERFVPLKEDLFAKSGTLLKRTVMSDVKKIDGRWYPTKVNYKDMLKDGKGTDFIVKEIQFDVEIPAHILSKASLKK